jgi:hypothetical protein
VSFLWFAAVSMDALVYWAISAFGVLVAFALLWIVRRIRKKPRQTLRWYAVLGVGVLGSMSIGGFAAAAATYPDELLGGALMAGIAVVVSVPFGLAFGLVFGTAAALLLYGVRGPAQRPTADESSSPPVG